MQHEFGTITVSDKGEVECKKCGYRTHYTDAYHGECTGDRVHTELTGIIQRYVNFANELNGFTASELATELIESGVVLQKECEIKIRPQKKYIDKERFMSFYTYHCSNCNKHIGAKGSQKDKYCKFCGSKIIKRKEQK